VWSHGRDELATFFAATSTESEALSSSTVRTGSWRLAQIPGGATGSCPSGRLHLTSFSYRSVPNGGG
jgi:hypothetical protein